MTEPASASSTTAPADSAGALPPSAPTERGWGKLLIALAAFLFVPMIPQVRALLPVEQTMMLFVPAVAACALVGWWAGGRAFLAIAWVAIAVLLTAQSATGGGDAQASAFYNLARGWSLLLAGAFGLVCLFAEQRPMFSRALVALGVTLGLAAVMSVLGPVTMSHASARREAVEFARRNARDDGDARQR